MSSNETLPSDRYRCYCEECDWETEARGQESAAGALFAHGLETGHADTYREKMGRTPDGGARDR